MGGETRTDNPKAFTSQLPIDRLGWLTAWYKRQGKPLNTLTRALELGVYYLERSEGDDELGRRLQAAKAEKIQEWMEDKNRNREELRNGENNSL